MPILTRLFIKTSFVYLGIGLAVGIVICILGFGVLPAFYVVYPVPGGLVLPVVGRSLPANVIYHVFPDGGALLAHFSS